MKACGRSGFSIFLLSCIRQLGEVAAELGKEEDENAKKTRQKDVPTQPASRSASLIVLGNRGESTGSKCCVTVVLETMLPFLLPMSRPWPVGMMSLDS